MLNLAIAVHGHKAVLLAADADPFDSLSIHRGQRRVYGRKTSLCITIKLSKCSATRFEREPA